MLWLREWLSDPPRSFINALRLIGFSLALLVGGLLLLRAAEYMVPFILAAVIATVIDPLVRLLTRIHVPRWLASLIAMLLVIGLLLTAVTLVVVKGVAELTDLVARLPSLYQGFSAELGAQLAALQEKTDLIDPATLRVINDSLGRVYAMLIDLLRPMTAGMLNTAAALPQAMVFVSVCMLATFFISRDLSWLKGRVAAQFPERFVRQSSKIKDQMFGALFGYIRAVLIIMAITFVELLIGFSILRMEYALVLALVIALLDSLPVIGCGTVMIPWTVITLIRGDIPLAVGIGLMYGVIWLVRQFIEPRIVGGQIGVYPLMTLVSIFLGVKLLGVMGVVLGPITFILLRNIYRAFTGGRSLQQYLRDEPPTLAK